VVKEGRKWLEYQELLVHLAGFFCTCDYTNVLFWAKMVHVSEMFIYPAVHLSGVHCMYAYSFPLLIQNVMFPSPSWGTVRMSAMWSPLTLHQQHQVTQC